MPNEFKYRAIAYYLPQYHPIPENDEWWGKGFTEWTNVTKTVPLFEGHYQPQLPSELGFYDLRVSEAREAQANLAREHGIEGFCYWHYWFAGERLLERPFEEVLKSGKPDFPFCLGWANHTWNGLWSGGDLKRVLKEQTYPGKEDHQRHFEYLLSAFQDKRYIRIDGKPLLVIYKPLHLPNSRQTLDYWRELAEKAGLPGLYVVATLDYGERNWDAKGHGFDAITVWMLGKVLSRGHRHLWPSRIKNVLGRRNLKNLRASVDKVFPGLDLVYDYEEIKNLLVCEEKFETPNIPMIVPNWDTTARYGSKAIVLHNSTPEGFREHAREVLGRVDAPERENRIVFLKSWNEWAEGNFLEPDRRNGRKYLEVIREELKV